MRSGMDGGASSPAPTSARASGGASQSGADVPAAAGNGDPLHARDPWQGAKRERAAAPGPATGLQAAEPSAPLTRGACDDIFTAFKKDMQERIATTVDTQLSAIKKQLASEFPESTGSLVAAVASRQETFNTATQGEAHELRAKQE